MFAAIAGFAVGFYLGTRTGKQGLEELRRSFAEIRESDEFKGLLVEVSSLATSTVRQATGPNGLTSGEGVQKLLGAAGDAAADLFGKRGERLRVIAGGT